MQFSYDQLESSYQNGKQFMKSVVESEIIKLRKSYECEVDRFDHEYQMIYNEKIKTLDELLKIIGGGL